MATVKNLKYAVVTSDADVVVARKMGGLDKNMVTFQQRKQLVHNMMPGDVLCVPSIWCIATGVYDFYRLMRELESKKIEFRSARECYLNFSNLKPLQAVCVDSVQLLARHEFEFNRFVQVSKLPEPSKAVLQQRICNEFMACLCIMFCNDGIRKRGA